RCSKKRTQAVAEGAVRIPPEASAEFVCQMEDVLEVYHRPFDPKRSLLGIDEASKQLVSEVTQPVAAAPGRPARFDYAYVREGSANLFRSFAPLLGWRHFAVTERRTAKDIAEGLRWLAADVHDEAEQLVLVTDNLNTHTPACLYEAFPTEQARRI